MRRAVAGAFLVLIVLAHAATPAFASGSFRRVSAVADGPVLRITFKEVGLEPGQNYAYSGGGTVRETFQCYRTRTFTPTPRTTTVFGAVSPDPRAYTADENGVVRGFINLWPDVAWPDLCHGAQETVPVGVCYQPSDLVNFVDPFDVYWFPDGTEICGPIEPD